MGEDYSPPSGLGGTYPPRPPVVQLMGSRGGHLWSTGHNPFFVNNSQQDGDRDANGAKRLGWLVNMLRKICILTYLCHDLTLTWPDLMSDFEIGLTRSKNRFS